jgi:hypothetical protein
MLDFDIRGVETWSLLPESKCVSQFVVNAKYSLHKLAV